MKGRGKRLLDMVTDRRKDPEPIEDEEPCQLGGDLSKLSKNCSQSTGNRSEPAEDLCQPAEDPGRDAEKEAGSTAMECDLPTKDLRSVPSPSILEPDADLDDQPARNDERRRVPKRQYAISPVNSGDETDFDDSDADPYYVIPIQKRKIIFSPPRILSPTPPQITRPRSRSSSSSSSLNSSDSSSSSSSSSSNTSSSSNNEHNAIGHDREIQNQNESTSSGPNQNNPTDNNGTAPREETVAGKKKLRRPETWKSNIAKVLKNSGKAYKSRGKLQKEVPPRQMRSPCGENCRLKCSEKLDTTARQEFFDTFWRLGDLQRQREFIVRHSQEVKPKYRYSSTQNFRALNTAFYFEKDNSRIRVCKVFFKATLDLGDQFIKTALIKKTDTGFIETDQRGKHNKHPTVDPTVKQSVVEFIDAIPRVESHYLRAQTTRQYIQSDRSLADIYRDYKSLRQENKLPFASESTFQRIFNVQFNIGFYSPKKDLCDLCESYTNANNEEKNQLRQTYEQHLIEKDLARNEKEKDKTESAAIVSVYDLQAVMPVPKGQVSVFFYKSRINCLNFTISDLHAKNVDCFFWDETEGKRGAVEIGSCVLAFIEMQLNDHPDEDINLIFYSDNCSGQQKNKYLLSAYAYAVSHNTRVKSITHKFLIRGHTQNEGDNVHSVIEKQVKRHLRSGPIYTPLQYATLIRTAKKTGKAYKVHEMFHERFFDLKTLQEGWGSNFNKDIDDQPIKWNELKIIKVTQEEPTAFFFKTSYAETEFKKCVVNKRKATRTVRALSEFPTSLSRAYTEKITLSDAKKKDIKELVDKNIIPKLYYDCYYKNIL